MAAERKPSRRTSAWAAALACIGLPLLAAPCTARAFTPADANTGGEANQAGPFANPFPDATTPNVGSETAGAVNGTPVPGSLMPPDYRYQQGAEPLVTGGLPAPGFTILPQITLQEEFNDNVLQTEANRRWDFITLLTPSVIIGANTPRLNLDLQYAPTLEYYARTSSQNMVSQQLSGVGSLIVVPDTLIVNARVFATVTPTNGGYGGAGFGAVAPVSALTAVNSFSYGGQTAGISHQGTSQIYGESVSPYLIHRFGSFGTGTLGVTLSETSVSNTVQGGGEQATTGEVSGQFQSGPVLGRVQNTASFDASYTDGSGVLSNQQQEMVNDRVGYALFHQLHVFGELGYEDIRYGGAFRERINDATWRLGFTFTPNRKSQITVSYGHEQGITSFAASVNYALTSRTTLAASYSESVTTYLQQVAAGINQAGVNQNGVPINATTGLPLNVVNGALAVQDTVYRTRTFYAGLTTLLDRDTIVASVDHTEETPLSTAAGAGFAQRETTGGFLWTHALNSRLTSTASLSYGTTSVAGFSGDSRLFGASAQLTDALTRTISTSASYLYFRRNSTAPGFSMYENVVFVGITKRF
ncbi:MAG: outer membrane beta-barrel protein [Acetobacteraceae bacterium]